MKFLPQWLAQLIGDSKFDATVERIVGRLEAPLWDRIVNRKSAMSAFEARGYIRARSMVLVAEQLALEVPPLTPEKQVKRLRQVVLHQLMNKMVHRLAVHTQQQNPRRRAA